MNDYVARFIYFDYQTNFKTKLKLLDIKFVFRDDKTVFLL